jgi:putative transposase
VTKTRDKKAALKFIKKSPTRHGHVDEIVTDLMRSYGAALRDLGIADRQATGRWVNNRGDDPHHPFRRREQAMLAFGGCEHCRSPLPFKPRSFRK